MSDHDLCQVATAHWAGEHREVRFRDPAEPVGVLTSLTGNGVLTAAEKQDRLRIGVVKVDLRGGAGNRDPSVAPKLGVRVGPGPPVTVAPLWSVCAVLHAPVSEPTVDDHLHGRVFTKRLAQRSPRVLSGSRDYDEEGALAIFHTGSPWFGEGKAYSQGPAKRARTIGGRSACPRAIRARPSSARGCVGSSASTRTNEVRALPISRSVVWSLPEDLNARPPRSSSSSPRSRPLRTSEPSRP